MFIQFTFPHGLRATKWGSFILDADSVDFPISSHRLFSAISKVCFFDVKSLHLFDPKIEEIWGVKALNVEDREELDSVRRALGDPNRAWYIPVHMASAQITGTYDKFNDDSGQETSLLGNSKDGYRDQRKARYESILRLPGSIYLEIESAEFLESYLRQLPYLGRKESRVEISIVDKLPSDVELRKMVLCDEEEIPVGGMSNIELDLSTNLDEMFHNQPAGTMTTGSAKRSIPQGCSKRMWKPVTIVGRKKNVSHRVSNHPQEIYLQGRVSHRMAGEATLGLLSRLKKAKVNLDETAITPLLNPSGDGIVGWKIRLGEPIDLMRVSSIGVIKLGNRLGGVEIKTRIQDVDIIPHTEAIGSQLISLTPAFIQADSVEEAEKWVVDNVSGVTFAKVTEVVEIGDMTGVFLDITTSSNVSSLNVGEMSQYGMGLLLPRSS